MGEIATQEGVTSNRYTILGRLAGGGMADIFLARVLSEGGVQRHVVLKRVLAERSRDPEFARMFLDEARLAAQLQHPNIAQLHDIGRLGGSYFYTMEYVHGADLRTMLATLARTSRQVPLNLAMLLATGALAALRHAHTRLDGNGRSLGVVHRDVTPSNVMVSYEGAVKLLDFGVAKATQHTVESRSGTIKGKIAYLSPEQCQNGGVDARSDLFSLGIVLHEMLVLRRLYKRDTDFATMMSIVNEPPPVPSSIRPEIPPELDAIVLKALAKDPAHRYGSAGEMLEAIETLAAEQRMVMSPTALGRFLCELVGERPEPWLELPASKTAEPTLITITGESVPDVVTSQANQMPDLAAEDELQAQLAAAPAIGNAVDDDSEPGGDSRSTAVAVPAGASARLATPPPVRTPTIPPPPVRRATPPAVPVVGVPQPIAHAPSGPTPRPIPHVPSGPTPVAIAPAPSGPTARPSAPSLAQPVPIAPAPSGPIATGHSGSMPVVPGALPVAGAPTPAPFDAPIPTPSGFPALADPLVVESARPSSGRDERALVTAAIQPLAFPSPDTEGARRRRIIALVVGVVVVVILIVAIAKPGSRAPAATPDAQPEPIALAPDAAAAVADAAALDEPVDAAAPDAAPPVPRTVPQQLDAAITARDWTLGVTICRREPKLAAADRARCAIVACSAKETALAVTWFNGLPRAARPAVDKACREQGISVAPRRGSDPCELNPLTCRK